MQQRVVTRMPLAELWDGASSLAVSRLRDLTAEDVHALLCAGQVQLVIAEIGAPLRGVPVGKCFAFWKAEVQPHTETASSNQGMNRGAMPTLVVID
jgi:hypothetical protein